MANEHIINNNLEVTGSIKSTLGFYGDGSNLTGISAAAGEWDGSRNGDASITGSLIVSGSNVVVDFQNIVELVASNVSGSFSGSYEGNGSGLTNLNLNGYEASGSNMSGSFSGSFEGDGSGLTGLSNFPFSGSAEITGSLTVTGSVVDFTDTQAISGSIFSGSFVGNGSGLTNLPLSEWDGSRNGDASITGSLVVSGSTPFIQLLGETIIDQNIEISNRSEESSIAIGCRALGDGGVENRRTIAIGCQSGFSQVSGKDNVKVGHQAGFSGVKTTGNIAIGSYSLYNNTGLDVGADHTLSRNIAIGCESLLNLTTGYENVAIGDAALRSNTTSQGNVAIGFEAGINVAGSSNVLIGKDAGREFNKKNVAIGHQAGYNSPGCDNVLIGYHSSKDNLGDRNVAIGMQSGLNSIGDSSNNVYIGTSAGPSTPTTELNELYIGVKPGNSALIRGNFYSGEVTINNCLKVAEASGSFVGDGSGLTGISGDGFPYNGAAVISGSLFVSQSTAAGTAVTVENGHTILTQVSESLNFIGSPGGLTSDQQAAAAGVPLGGLYRSKNVVLIRIR